MSPLVSVVVPTYRRPHLLDRCLQALLRQNFNPADYEIIVVADGPEDAATRALVLNWQQRMRVRVRDSVRDNVRDSMRDSLALPVLPEVQAVSVGGAGKRTGPATATIPWPNPASDCPPGAPRLVYLPARRRGGPAAARNLGWHAAAGEIIAFTDDDTLPDPNWLANGLAAFVDGVAGVSGRVVVPLSEHPTDNEKNTTGLERSDFVTANCFYRRTALEQVGGFDERFRIAWREDSDLYFTLRERGYPLAWAPEAVVYHPVRPEAWGSSIGQQRKSFYNGLLYKKHPALYRQFIQPGPPWHYYGMLLGLGASLSGLLGSNKGLLLGGLVAWLGLLGRFIFQRLRGTSLSPRHLLEMLVTSAVIPFLSVYWRIRGALHWRVFFF